MSDPVLTSRNISRCYLKGANEIKAVDRVSVDIKRGVSLSVTGASGAGKSTLLQMLGGLDSPSSGSVLLDGIDIYKLPDRKRARIRNERIGFVFQFYHLLPEFSVLENVMLPAMIGGRSLRKTREKAMRILQSIGLGERIAHRPSELSGGESQRAAIARALMNDPEILLCDEPAGNLDSSNSESIYRLLFDMTTESNVALVIVTHDETLSRRTDFSIRLKDGRVVS